MEEITEHEYLQNFVDIGYKCWNSKQQGYHVFIKTEGLFDEGYKLTIEVAKEPFNKIEDWRILETSRGFYVQRLYTLPSFKWLVIPNGTKEVWSCVSYHGFYPSLGNPILNPFEDKVQAEDFINKHAKPNQIHEVYKTT